jgi:hypothetical protein
MPTALSGDALHAALETATGAETTAQEWADFCSLSRDDQAFAAKGWLRLKWIKKPDVVANILAILGPAAQIAGDVAGIGGAVGALLALKAVL